MIFQGKRAIPMQKLSDRMFESILTAAKVLALGAMGLIMCAGLINYFLDPKDKKLKRKYRSRRK